MPELINLINVVQAAQSQKTLGIIAVAAAANDAATAVAGSDTANGSSSGGGGGGGVGGGSQHISGTNSPTQGQSTFTPSSSTPLRTSFAYMSPELAKRYVLIQERKGLNGVVRTKGDNDKEPGLAPWQGPDGGGFNDDSVDTLGQGLGDKDLSTSLVKKSRVTWSGKNDVQGPGLGSAIGPGLGPGEGQGEGAEGTNVEDTALTGRNNINNSNKHSTKSSEAGSSENDEDNDEENAADGDVKKDNSGGGGGKSTKDDEDDDNKEVTRLEGGLNLAAMDIWAVGDTSIPTTTPVTYLWTLLLIITTLSKQPYNDF